MRWTKLKCEGKDTKYIISDKGNVINAKTGHEMSRFFADGFYRVSVGYDKASTRPRNLALLMIESFENRLKKDDEIIYFLDENRSNINLDNIRFISPKDLLKININKLLDRREDGYFILKDGNLDDERWLPLSYNKLDTQYLVSDNGRILNVVNNILLKNYSDPHSPYPMVTLRLAGKSVRIFIHRLVALLFVPNTNPDKFNIVHHKDENVKNYHYSNLEWADDSLNHLYSLRSGNSLSCEDCPQSTITNETAKEICQMLQDGYRICEIVSDLGVSRNVVRHIKEGKSWRKISENYDFSNMFSNRLTQSDYDNILKYSKEGKTVKEISEIMHIGTTTVSTAKRKLGISRPKRSKAISESLIIVLHNDGVSIKDISDIIGLRKSEVKHILTINETI